MKHSRNVPTILKRPMDPELPENPQLIDRFNAIYRLHEISPEDPKRLELLGIQMAKERYSKAFTWKKAKLDPRQKVRDRRRLVAVVRAIEENDPSGLPADLQVIAKRALRKLKELGNCQSKQHLRGLVKDERH